MVRQNDNKKIYETVKDTIEKIVSDIVSEIVKASMQKTAFGLKDKFKEVSEETIKNRLKRKLESITEQELDKKLAKSEKLMAKAIKKSKIKKSDLIKQIERDFSDGSKGYLESICDTGNFPTNLLQSMFFRGVVIFILGGLIVGIPVYVFSDGDEPTPPIIITETVTQTVTEQIPGPETTIINKVTTTVDGPTTTITETATLPAPSFPDLRIALVHIFDNNPPIYEGDVVQLFITIENVGNMPSGIYTVTADVPALFGPVEEVFSKDYTGLDAGQGNPIDTPIKITVSGWVRIRVELSTLDTSDPDNNHSWDYEVWVEPG